MLVWRGVAWRGVAWVGVGRARLGPHVRQELAYMLGHHVAHAPRLVLGDSADDGQEHGAVVRLGGVRVRVRARARARVGVRVRVARLSAWESSLPMA